MPHRAYNLAIETSSRHGSITLGRCDELLATADLMQARRHNVPLVPAIDRLCRQHGIGPADLGQVYVSIGPGSFTGLRVAVAAVKMLAMAQGVRVAAVPTLDVLAQNAPPEAGHVAVCLNMKGQTCYSGVYRWAGGLWKLVSSPLLRTMEELLREAPRPVAVLGDPLPALPAELAQDEGVTILPATLAQPRSEAVWRLGRAMAQQGAWADAMRLTPLYAREPEAVTLWEKRHGQGD
ncbi:MAG TPA: tRNA (adenosine(37)-N6)-threonylcarbamoyltransferase complex dimerization subunit type 1 TsaB [Phycisphaeraceae bacterium]